MVNSLAPGRSQCDFKNVIFNLALLIGIFILSYKNVLLWMPQALTDDKSILVQVMAWYHQATSHCLNQCWPRSSKLYGVTRPRWVKITTYASHMNGLILKICNFIANELELYIFLNFTTNMCNSVTVNTLWDTTDHQSLFCVYWQKSPCHCKSYYGWSLHVCQLLTAFGSLAMHDLLSHYIFITVTSPEWHGVSKH